MRRRRRARNARAIVAAALGFAVLLVVSLVMLPSQNSATHRNTLGSKEQSSFLGSHHLPKPPSFRGKKRYRVAIVIPFVGETVESIPPYLNLFCTSAAGSASLVDFLVIHNGVLDHYHQPVPPNVKFISLGSTAAFVERLLRVVDQRNDDELEVPSRATLAKIVSKHIHYYPYVLVEFKPAFGHIFDDMLQLYSHWGYSDLDIVFGDLPRWITPEELVEFDIVTYGYGDQNRVYLRGQFTIHRNVPRVNQLWRNCTYLSEMDVRFAQVLSGKKKLHVESAEGCYSKVVLQQTDLRVKYAVKAMNDIDDKDPAHTHGLYLGIGSDRDRSVVYKARSSDDGKSLLQLPSTWFENRDNAYGSRERRPLQREVGSRELVERDETKASSHCMYWVPEKYQKAICAAVGVLPTDTLFWIDGTLFKQRFENMELPGNIQSAPLFHFQEWKRYYRIGQLASVHRSADLLGWVLAKEGAIPLLPNREHRGRRSPVLAPLGVHVSRWQGVLDRSQLPIHRYCLRSGPRKVPSKPPAPHCEYSVSWQDSDSVEIHQGAHSWNHVDTKNEVTLAMTVQITSQHTANDGDLDGLLEVLIINIRAWQGQPCVLVVHVARGSTETVSRIRRRLNKVDLDACLVALINSDDDRHASRKALTNMAYDASPTRWVVTGLEVERGMVLSNEASLFAYRKSKVYTETTGNVFVVPQFAIKNEDLSSDIALKWLVDLKLRGKPRIHPPDDFDEDSDCNDPDHSADSIFAMLWELWWNQTRAEINGLSMFGDDVSLPELAVASDDMQLSFERLLTSQHHYDLFALDVAPIVMVDSLGPRRGMKTAELVREVEEFGGKQCYNGMRLAQLATLGYRINTLSGAFAISTSGSRRSAFGLNQEDLVGSSRCDGCFMFDDSHEDILENIVHDERQRPAKAAVLWSDMYQTL